MLDLDQRVVEGLNALAERAPVTADVWPATKHYVGKRRRARRAVAGAAMVVVLAVGGLAAVALTRRDDTKTSVATARPAVGDVAITASPTGTLTFGPSALTLHTGLYDITLIDGANAQHTLEFDDPATRWPGLMVNGVGEVKTARIFFGEPGDYTFYCEIVGHRAAGMQGVVHVTGRPMTYAQALAAKRAG